MSELYTIIPAAGESRRFKEAGFSTPKPFLRLESSSKEIKAMLAHVFTSASAGEIHIGVNSFLSLPKSAAFPTVFHDIEKTIGQADTVYQIVKDFPPDARVLVMDCDMILQKTDVQRLVDLLDLYDMTVAVTETFDPNASRVDQVPFPTRFVEKEPISQWGIVGARAFRSAGVLTDALECTLDLCKEEEREPYLSEAMNNYEGTKYAHVITEYVDLGTPERVEAAGWKIV